ncbi:hypothetical protein OEA41_009129, partial [Lepraria neglecta]
MPVILLTNTRNFFQPRQSVLRPKSLRAPTAPPSAKVLSPLTLPLILPSPEIYSNVPVTASTNNSTNLGYTPTCYVPDRWRIPIIDPSDCNKATDKILNEGPEGKDDP